MYTVIWCNQEGIQQERRFDSLEDACTEYNDIKERYDGADILDENDNSVLREGDAT